MRNYILDWNNKAVIVVKKAYRKECCCPSSPCFMEKMLLEKDGWAFRDGTMYDIRTVENFVRNVNFAKMLNRL